jgi:hypothetical protein
MPCTIAAFFLTTPLSTLFFLDLAKTMALATASNKGAFDLIAYKHTTHTRFQTHTQHTSKTNAITAYSSAKTLVTNFAESVSPFKFLITLRRPNPLASSETFSAVKSAWTSLGITAGVQQTQQQLHELKIYTHEENARKQVIKIGLRFMRAGNFPKATHFTISVLIPSFTKYCAPLEHSTKVQFVRDLFCSIPTLISNCFFDSSITPLEFESNREAFMRCFKFASHTK